MKFHNRVSQSRIAAMSFVLACVPIQAATTHEFCVTRLEISGPSSTRARIYFQGTDPGREIAGETLIQHFRRAGKAPIRLDDSTGGACQHADTQHIVVDDATALEHPSRVEEGLPNVGRAARQASGALTEIAQEASRLMCRMLPC